MPVELRPEEVRVLGCLVEKEATTPDAYPLSTNALLAACNQRSSRDPIVDFEESTVTAALVSLRERGLARTTKGSGSRVYKHAHTLRGALGLDGGALAVLAVLMLRGPQTVGELRIRTERQHAFGSLDEIEDVLAGLARREAPLARELPREPGRRESRWTHLLGDDAAAPRAPSPSREALSLEELASDLSALRREVEGLRAQVEALGAGR